MSHPSKASRETMVAEKINSRGQRNETRRRATSTQYKLRKTHIRIHVLYNTVRVLPVTRQVGCCPRNHECIPALSVVSLDSTPDIAAQIDSSGTLTSKNGLDTQHSAAKCQHEARHTAEREREIKTNQRAVRSSSMP